MQRIWDKRNYYKRKAYGANLLDNYVFRSVKISSFLGASENLILSFQEWQ